VGVAGTTVDLGRDEINGPQWAKACEVFGACGGAAVYRRSMLQEIGFLDDEFFMIYEDVDLSFRAQLCGYACMYVPSAIVFHRYRASLSTRPFRQVFFSQRNIEFVYLKNMPAGLLLRSFLQHFLYEIGAGMFFVEKGSTGAFLKAKFAVLKHLPQLLRKRRRIQRKKSISNAELRALMSPTFSSKWRKLCSVYG
jgi:GT2 family glycosyltransferase